jgi:hypothetical protein
VTITGTGLAVIGFTGAGATRPQQSSLASMIAVEAAIVVVAIALTSVAPNLAAIIGGILVFHDPIGSGPLAITGRFVAFCLVIAGAALMPAPVRAAPDTT